MLKTCLEIAIDFEGTLSATMAAIKAILLKASSCD